MTTTIATTARASARAPGAGRFSGLWQGLSITGLLAVVFVTVLAAFAPVALGAVEWRTETRFAPTVLTPGQPGQLLVVPGNKGTTDSSGMYELKLQLPPGVTRNGPVQAINWSCGGLVTVTCTSSATIKAGSMALNVLGGVPFLVNVDVSPAAFGTSQSTVTMSGGGAAGVSVDVQEVSFGSPPLGFDFVPGSVFAGALDESGVDFTQAGGHPFEGVANFDVVAAFNAGSSFPAENFKNVVAELPPGFVGDPTAVPYCAEREFQEDRCPAESQVGVSSLYTGLVFNEATSAVYNIEPSGDRPAQFGFRPPQGLTQKLDASVRSDGDFGVSVAARDITELAASLRSHVTIWGYPMDAVHDDQRCATPNYVSKTCNGVSAANGGPLPEAVAQPSDVPRRPFLSNPTQCVEVPQTRLRMDSWSDPAPSLDDGGEAQWVRATVVHPMLTGCELVPFDPSMSLAPSGQTADSPAGIAAKLHVPREGDRVPDGLVQAHLKKSTVTLPEGLSLSPSAANGLGVCTPAQIGLASPVGATPARFDKAEPTCPAASKLGTAKVVTHLLPDPLTGEVFLAAQGDNPFGSTFALYVVVRGHGILVKLAGRVDTDPVTGRVSTVFDENPQLPFTDLDLVFDGGPRAPLAMPLTCGSFTIASQHVPWSAADPDNPTADEVVDSPSTFDVTGGPNGQGCATSKAGLAFDLGLSGGTRSAAAGSRSPFDVRITRPDGVQEVSQVEVSPPAGLLASLRGIPYCSEAAIAAAGARSGRSEQAGSSCPAGSEVGSTLVGAGPGSDPFFAPGKVYLAGPYKGAPLSAVAITPAVTGPFDLGNVVVRTALHVDRRSARVTAVTDALPEIVGGVPLRIRDIRVTLDRPGWTLNPTDCSPAQLATTVRSNQGARTDDTVGFRASGCKRLPFKPNLKLTLTGKRQTTTGKHPGIKAQVTQKPGEAAIERAEVRLPKTLALDPDNAQALCEFADGTKDEPTCPKGSIVGKAKAITPLLDKPLAGNVYFVKNIRTDPKTGNQIRTLPMIVVALRGQIAINLRGESSVKAGKLVNTFTDVPDAPVSKFNLNIQGGRNGILAVTRTAKRRLTICGRQTAETDWNGQSGRTLNTNIRINTPCKAKQGKTGTAKKRKAAARRKTTKRRG